MIITRKSPFTGNLHSMDINITKEMITCWGGGELIQNIMPHLTPDEREFLISGITPGEWIDTFGVETS